MPQQKQQKNTRTDITTSKDQKKVGLLLKKTQFPPIQTNQGPKGKNYHSLDHFVLPKKKKIPDIYYQGLECQKVQKSNIISTIYQRDSQQQNSEILSQTVIKMHEKKKPPMSQFYLCNKHNKKVCDIHNEKINDVLQNKRKQKLLIHNCCGTKPSEQFQNQESRTKMIFSHPQLNKIYVNSSFVQTPKRLKPIELSADKQSGVFSPFNKYFPHLKSPHKVYYLSAEQTRQMTDKLSRPKCEKGRCGKRNCQCFYKNLENQQSSLKGFKSIKHNKVKQIKLQKMKVNLDKNLNSNDHQAIKAWDQDNLNNLKERMNEKRTLRKKFKLNKVHRSNTEAMEDKLRNQSTQNSNSQRVKPNERQVSSSNVTSEDEGFIKGIVNPVKMRRRFHTKESYENQQDIKKVEMQIQTEDNLIVKDQEITCKTPQKLRTINVLPLLTKKKQPQMIEKTYENVIIQQIGLISEENQKIEEEIKKQQKYENREAVPNQKKLLKDDLISNRNQKKEKITQKKSKAEKQQSLKTIIQYWIRFDISKKVFIDLLSPKEQTFSPSKKQKIGIISEVINEKIDMKKKNQPQSKQSKEGPVSIQNSQISTNNYLDKIQNIPIRMKSPIQQNNALSSSRNIKKSRICFSSSTSKSPINMFNRSPKTIASSRSKKYFKIPKQQQYVALIKNYQPIHKKIIISDLVKHQKFKVIPSKSQFYFGQVNAQSLKHGLGVEITLHEIFQGQFVEGNRTNGVLKQHDGHYEGPFLNNLRHGHGIFRWNNGQVFEGEWRMGTKNGYGVWKGTDGSHYEGEWHLSMQHGKGKFVHCNSTYEGDFKNFCKDGFGKQTFLNGDVYHGQYTNGKPNGKGKYEWKDGTYYEGQFADGLRNGYGKWHQNLKSFYEGEFLKDEKHGKGTQYYKDGSYLQGLFKNGKITQGKLYNSQKQLVEVFDEIIEQTS